MKRDTGRRIARGALAGVVAGVVASFAMERFQSGVSALSTDDDKSEPSTQRAADAVARTVSGDELAKIDKPLGGQAMHYLLGTALGVGYGIVAEFVPAVTTGGGTLFGVGTAVVLDEAVVPATGLGDSPTETPLSTHAYSLAAHLVFGGVSELVRRQMAGTFEPA